MLLYQFRMGTNPRRVIIYLSEKGIDVPFHELDCINETRLAPDDSAIDPPGRVPTLITDQGATTTESAANVEYLEELYPEGPMIGTDALSRAGSRLRTARQRFDHPVPGVAMESARRVSCEDRQQRVSDGRCADHPRLDARYGRLRARPSPNH